MNFGREIYYSESFPLLNKHRGPYIFPGGDDSCQKAGSFAPRPGDGVLGVAEGIETAESVFQATGIATWATVSAGGMERFEVPADAGISRVHIFADNDASGVGQRAADTLARRLVAQGFEVSVLLPPDQDKDWNDVLAQGGEKPIQEALAGAKPFDPALSPLANLSARLVTPATSAGDAKMAKYDPVLS